MQISDLSIDEQAELRTTVGRISFGVEMRVVDPDSQERVDWDGESSGELQVSGNWIAKTYYNDERANESFTSDGWLRTGDVASVDEREGFDSWIEQKISLSLEASGSRRLSWKTS